MANILKSPVQNAVFAARDYIRENPKSYELNEESLVASLEEALEGHFSEDDSKSAAHQVASEITKIKKDPGTYLVDDSSGKMLFKVSADMIYNPPNTIDESGMVRSQLPMVHPGITSGMAMVIQEKEQNELIKASVPQGMSESIAHIQDPWRIIEHTTLELGKLNVTVCKSDDLKDEITFDVGLENSDGMGQSPNFHFHRSVLYGSSLARKIARTGAVRCAFKSIERKRTSKKTWFEVSMLYSKES